MINIITNLKWKHNQNSELQQINVQQRKRKRFPQQEMLLPLFCRLAMGNVNHIIAKKKTYHSSASAHSPVFTTVKLLEIVRYPLHSPDLSPSDYLLLYLNTTFFYQMTKFRLNKLFLLSRGVRKVEHIWTKYIDLHKDYVDK